MIDARVVKPNEYSIGKQSMYNVHAFVRQSWNANVAIYRFQYSLAQAAHLHALPKQSSRARQIARLSSPSLFSCLPVLVGPAKRLSIRYFKWRPKQAVSFPLLDSRYRILGGSNELVRYSYIKYYKFTIGRPEITRKVYTLTKYIMQKTELMKGALRGSCGINLLLFPSLLICKHSRSQSFKHS